MLNPGVVLVVSILYLALLFGVAVWGDRRAEAGRSLTRNPFVYTMSLGLYCSAWTFYGSVGLASREGLAFLPIYLGPTLFALLFPSVMRKMVRIAKAQGITSIADFIAARYGKSATLAGIVTVVAVLATVPYIALQLKAVGASVAVLLPPQAPWTPDGGDVTLLVALTLALFSVLFGARVIDATERHEGIVLAVALESVVKLVAFVAVGAFVTWGLFGGFRDLLGRYAAAGHGLSLTIAGSHLNYADWALLSLLSALAYLTLPRQFQVGVIENHREEHLLTASWLLPLYFLAINLFVVPLAIAGTLMGAGDGDLFVLRLPLDAGWGWLALLAYVGGLSAAAAMVIVATVALSIMVSNDLLFPVMLRYDLLGLRRRRSVTDLIVNIRRGVVLIVIALAYLFYHLVGERYGLVNIGLIAFTGIAQFAPLILLGIYWRGATLAGALAGLVTGVGVWFYTLVLPAMLEAFQLTPAFVTDGPFGLQSLKPRALFGLDGLNPNSHAVLWSLSANLLVVVATSLLGRQGNLERVQAALFVDIEQQQSLTRLWRGEAQVAALRDLLARFLGTDRADAIFAMDARRRGHALPLAAAADAALVQMIERQLARAIGSASSRVMVASVVHGEDIGPGDLMEILDEASQLMDYSRRLEQKSTALEKATHDLKVAYDRVRQLDQLKDEFVATVSHELRTPLTSIRSFSEILLDTPDLSDEERRHFLQIVVREADRLTRLVNDVLDLSKIESGRMDWHVGTCDLREILDHAVAATSGLCAEKGIAVSTEHAAASRATVRADRDRLVQVVVNLLSNAAKFVPEEGGRVLVRLLRHEGTYIVRVEDNGPGVPEGHRETVFEKFRQVTGGGPSKPRGTGLGLTISREIVEHFGGRIWLEDASLGGAAVCFTLPEAEAETDRAAA